MAIDEKLKKCFEKIQKAQEEKKFDHALNLIDKAYDQHASISSKYVESNSADHLLEKLRKEKRLNEMELKNTGEILNEEGKVHFRNKNYSKSEQCLQKALKIFDYLNQSGKSTSTTEIIQKIQTLKQ